ncbi:hypothetical protein EMIT0P201_12035 [Pseudomonas chlororaphis]
MVAAEISPHKTSLMSRAQHLQPIPLTRNDPHPFILYLEAKASLSDLYTCNQLRTVWPITCSKSTTALPVLRISIQLAHFVNHKS